MGEGRENRSSPFYSPGWKVEVEEEDGAEVGSREGKALPKSVGGLLQVRPLALQRELMLLMRDRCFLCPLLEVERERDVSCGKRGERAEIRMAQAQRESYCRER